MTTIFLWGGTPRNKTLPMIAPRSSSERDSLAWGKRVTKKTRIKTKLMRCTTRLMFMLVSTGLQACADQAYSRYDHAEKD